MIGILDYGLGNIYSVSNAFEYLNCRYKIVNSAQDISKMDSIVIPGVGNFKHGVESLERQEILSEINDFALIQKKPVLGICLGMQLMASKSEEGGVSKGLGWFDFNVKEIKVPGGHLKTPVVGWIEVEASDSLLLNNISRPTFYFVHSFYVSGNSKHVTSTYDSGVCIAASVERDNIFGVQFHPEKSQQDGLRVLDNFSKM